MKTIRNAVVFMLLNSYTTYANAVVVTGRGTGLAQAVGGCIPSYTSYRKAIEDAQAVAIADALSKCHPQEVELVTEWIVQKQDCSPFEHIKYLVEADFTCH